MQFPSLHFTYTIVQTIPADAETVVFEDALEEVLEVVSAKMVGNTATYTDESNGNLVKFVCADVKADRGAKLTLEIVAKIKDGVTDEQLLAKYAQTTEIPNTAKVSINGEGKTTNTVFVTPPEEPEPKTEPTTTTENGESEAPEPSSQEEEESEESEPDEGGAIPPVEDEEPVPVGDESEMPTEPSQPMPPLPPVIIEIEPSQPAPTAPESEIPTLPDTGDHSNMLLYFGLMCLAAAGSGLLIAKGKKRED